MFGGTIFLFLQITFRGSMLCPAEGAQRRWLGGFYFAAAITSNAEDQLHHHVRTENDDLRDGGEPGAMAANSPPLSLYPLPRT